MTRQEPGHAKSPMPWILDLGFSESTVGLLLEVRLVGKQKERCHENSATAARPGRPMSHAQIRVQQAVPFPWSCRPPSGFPTPQDLPPVSGSQRWWPLLWVPQTPVAVAGVGVGAFTVLMDGTGTSILPGCPHLLLLQLPVCMGDTTLLH